MLHYAVRDWDGFGPDALAAAGLTVELFVDTVDVRFELQAGWRGLFKQDEVEVKGQGLGFGLVDWQDSGIGFLLVVEYAITLLIRDVFIDREYF